MMCIALGFSFYEVSREGFGLYTDQVAMRQDSQIQCLTAIFAMVVW